jgi:hypothetical protein
VEERLAACGYAFVKASEMRQALEVIGALSDWRMFVASWNDLPLDEYLAESQRCRRRRFAVYAIAPGDVVERQPHQPHYQHRDYNVLFGGIERWFAPMAADVGAGPTMRTILRFCDRLFRSRMPSAGTWHVEVHQFRIEARSGAAGHPTPEGVHRDGVDFVLVLLINRENIVSGTTTVYTGEGDPLGAFTLTDPLDAALVDDNRVAHGVTPIMPLDRSRPGHRDVLVVTFRAPNLTRRSGTETTETTGSHRETEQRRQTNNPVPMKSPFLCVSV